MSEMFGAVLNRACYAWATRTFGEGHAIRYGSMRPVGHRSGDPRRWFYGPEADRKAARDRARRP